MRHCERIGACPVNWVDRLWADLDFEASFAELDACRTHWYSNTLRGYIRIYQHRCEEALEHFAVAEDEYSDAPQADESRILILKTRAFRVNAFFLHEAILRGDNDAQSRTDDAIGDLILTEEFGTKTLYEAKTELIARWLLMRGRPAKALEFYNWLIAQCDSLTDAEFPFYLGAAVAAHELADENAAMRHLESAELAFAIVNAPFRIGIYAARMYAISLRWGRTQDANRWLRILMRVTNREDVQRLFMERAELMIDALEPKKGGVVIV